LIHSVISPPNHVGLAPKGCLVGERFRGARVLRLVVCVSISMAFSKLHMEDQGFRIFLWGGDDFLQSTSVLHQKTIKCHRLSVVFVMISIVSVHLWWWLGLSLWFPSAGRSPLLRFSPSHLFSSFIPLCSSVCPRPWPSYLKKSSVACQVVHIYCGWVVVGVCRGYCASGKAR